MIAITWILLFLTQPCGFGVPDPIPRFHIFQPQSSFGGEYVTQSDALRLFLGIGLLLLCAGLGPWEAERFMVPMTSCGTLGWGKQDWLKEKKPHSDHIIWVLNPSMHQTRSTPELLICVKAHNCLLAKLLICHKCLNHSPNLWGV